MKITNGVKSVVNAYLTARTLAECEREKVNNLARVVLATTTYHAVPKFVTMGYTSKRIFNPAKSWMLKDEEHNDYLVNLKKALEKAGYKIKHNPNEPKYSFDCPALTAEKLQRNAEHLIIETVAEMLGEKDDLTHNLIWAGLDKYYQFIDLVVKMVVNMPGFKNPLTA